MRVEVDPEARQYIKYRLTMMQYKILSLKAKLLFGQLPTLEAA